MKANILLNVVVISQNNGRRHGLVKSLVVVDHVVKYLVINPGGILSKAQFFKPENIVDVNYKRMVIGNEKDIIKVNGKKVKAYLEEAFPLMDYQVVDINGRLLGMWSMRPLKMIHLLLLNMKFPEVFLMTLIMALRSFRPLIWSIRIRSYITKKRCSISGLKIRGQASPINCWGLNNGRFIKQKEIVIS